MGLLRMAAVGALGYVGWKYYEKQRDQSPPAFAKGQEPGENVAKVRDAGPAVSLAGQRPRPGRANPRPPSAGGAGADGL